MKKQTILDEVKNWLSYKVEPDYTEKAILEELQLHGCISGMVSELIYYYDTNRFYNKHRAEIFKLVDEYCESTGETLKDFLMGANHFPLDKDELNRETFVGGISGLIRKNPDYAEQIKNWFAWFAFEDVAYRYYTETHES